jgi:pimeloyl-ACP methyl ester carboxylesterase
MPVPVPESIYRTNGGEAEIHAIYDRQLARLNSPHKSRLVTTRFGNTHLLELGPEGSPPLVVLHGGNTTSPLTLGWLRPLIGSYRVYAPDTIGHPGKSAPVRLSPHDDSYGQWLVEVLDALGLQYPPVLAGSYGAGIFLRAAVYAPERFSRAVLLIPSGLVSIPVSTMLYMLWWMGFYRLAPSRSRLERLLWPIVKDEPVDEALIEITEAVFRNMRIESEMPRNVTRQELVRFKAPVLVLAAERDGLFPAAKVVKRAREVFPHLVAAEMMPGATHYLPARYHSELNERCERFLKQTT